MARYPMGESLRPVWFAVWLGCRVQVDTGQLACPVGRWLATTLLRGGANLRTTQECMRHASVASAALYTQVTDAERSAAVLALA
jgi:site-specific recombinase XerC